MIPVTTIVFQREEAETFARASLALRVAFPGAGCPRHGHDDLPAPRHSETGEPIEDEQAIRIGNALGDLSRFDPVRRDYLERAYDVFAYTLRVCEREAAPSFWEQFVPRGEPMSEQTRVMAEAIVVARRQFVDDLRPAVVLLAEAIAVSSPMPTNEKWDDDLDLVAERVDAVLDADR